MIYIKECRVDASIGIGHGHNIGTGRNDGIDLRGLSVGPVVGIRSSTAVWKCSDVSSRIAMASYIDYGTWNK